MRAEAQPPAIFVGRDEELARLRSALERLRLAVIYGVPGVGKSSFLLHAAGELAARLKARLVHRPCEPGESVATVAAAALGKRAAGEPIDALVAAAGKSPLVLALDDVQRARGTLVDAMVHLAARRVPLWILIASREALPISPVSLDHAVVRLPPFDAERAALLWRELSQAYGVPPLPLSAVAGAGATTPLRLKQAFAGPATPRSDDPLSLGALSPDEAEVLARLVAFRRPVPPEAIAPAPGLERLLARFLVEPVEGKLTVHDLVRDAVRASARPPGPAEERRALEWWRAHPGDDEGAVEQLHHAIRVGETDEALRILGRHALDIGRVPPGTAVIEQHLAEAIDLLAAKTTLPDDVRLLRARIRARQGDPQRAFVEMRPLLADSVAAMEFGSIGVAIGRLDEAIPALERVRDDAQAGPLLRMMAVVSLAGAHRHQGRIAEIRRALDGAEPLAALSGGLGRGVLAWVRAVLELECEEPEAAARRIAEARAHLQPLSELAISLPLIASVERTVHALLGAAVNEDAPDELFDEVPFFRATARILRLEELLVRGHTREAAALGATLLEDMRATGYPGLEQGAAALLAEAERLLGRIDDARSRLPLDAAERAPRAHLRVRAVHARVLLSAGLVEEARGAASSTLRVVRDAPAMRARLHATAALAAAISGAAVRPPRASSPPASHDTAQATLDFAEALLWQGRAGDAELLLQPLGDAPWPEVRCRAALLRAEVAWRTGELSTAAARLAQARAEAEQHGWALHAVRGALIGAALARTRGEDASAEALAGEALVRAEAGGLLLDAEAARVALGRARKLAAGAPGRRLAARLALDEPMKLQLRDAEGHRLLGGALDADHPRYQLFIDFVARRVRVGRKTVDLGRRGALVDLLRALADRPGQTVPVEQLTRAVWGVDYHPLRHHSRVTMAVSRLRALLGANAIEGGTDGYRLMAERWAILEPRTR